MATSGASNGVTGGVAGQISDPRQAGNGMDGGDYEGEQGPKERRKVDPKEIARVKKRWKKYEDARKFDENFRKQIAIDRRYAAGTSDLSWAVTTNLIGAFIDILVALLYARNPDVDVRKSPQVEEDGTMPIEVFARTLEIVISRLWKDGKLKKAARKGVRSVLSNAEGWFKATMRSDKDPQPEVESELNDAKALLARLDAVKRLIADPQDGDPECTDELIAEKQMLTESLQSKIDQAVTKMFIIDFVPTENVQVSTDVSHIEDYLEAGWVSDELYLDKDDVLTRFPDLEQKDLEGGKLYYQRQPRELTTRDIDNVLPQGTITAESASSYTTQGSEAQTDSFYRVVELWDRNDKHIYTMIDGVDRWAKEPYLPPYPTKRFYPYFYFAFFEVDGQRHPQSLSWRLYKLQDEYSSSRSAYRITRQRSIPGVIVNATGIDDINMRKIQESKEQEFTAVRFSDPNIKVSDVMAAKPVPSIDMRLYDPTLILNDMERISGVQEALSAAASAGGNPKTATEANIEQSGTNARTTSNRDNLEEMLTDMAQYTAEQALQCLTVRDVQRIAGPKAFWPGPDETTGTAGMDIEDIQTLVEVSIEAGTTGKPRQAGDMQAWSTLLPLLKDMLQQIRAALAAGDTATVNSLTELVKETMKRLGDDEDPERFIPKIPPPGSPGAGGPPPPVVPQVSISLKGEISPDQAAAIAQPILSRDQASAAPPPNAAGANPAGSQPAIPGPPPGAPATAAP